MVLIWTVGGVGLDEDDLDDYQLLLQRSFLESPPATGEECSDAYAAAAAVYESTFAVEHQCCIYIHGAPSRSVLSHRPTCRKSS